MIAPTKRAYRKNGVLTVRCNVTVNELDRAYLIALGNGNLSAGIALACDAVRKAKPVKNNLPSGSNLAREYPAIPDVTIRSYKK